MRRLWLKIFSVLVLANIAFALLLYWGFTWSFEATFEDYLERQDSDRFTPLAEALADIYEVEDQWQWVIDEHQRWRELMGRYIIRPGESTANAPANLSPVLRGERPPAGQAVTNNGMNPHIMLFDKDGQLIIGGKETQEKIYRFPIERNGDLYGHIGVRADTRLLKSMQAVMENYNNNRLTAIILGLITVSSILAFGIATWLTRRIYRLKGATSALVRGHYDKRLTINGQDALDSLGHDFNDLAETLEENRTAHRRWIASTSHELRTPVTILQGQIEALRDGIRKVTPDYLEGLSNDIERLNRLIDDLHQLSMSDLGALDYQKDDVDLTELVSDELDKFRSILPEQLTLSWNPHGQEPVFVLGDSRRLSQLVINLMQNSIRYTDVPGSIQVDLSATANTVTLTWQDSSPGVSESECKLLTQPLYRAEASRSREAAGSGLGLAIVQAIVKAHEGTLQAAQSELGGLKWTMTFQRISSES